MNSYHPKRTSRFAIALVVGLSAAACASQPPTCDGLRLVPLKPATAAYLVTNDRSAAVVIAGNNEMLRKTH